MGEGRGSTNDGILPGLFNLLRKARIVLPLSLDALEFPYSSLFQAVVVVACNPVD